MNAPPTGSHRTTYDAVFQHPVARNLKWVDVRSMLVSLADSVDERGDVLKLTRNGKTLTLHRPTRSGMDDVAELMKVRHFLDHPGPSAGSTPAAAAANAGDHLLVVIDHRQARVYRTEMQGSLPLRITPHDPAGSGRHLHHVEDDHSGQRKPEPKAFYEAVARALRGARQVLLFGGGTGASSAMDHLLAELKQNHPDLAARVVGSLVVDEPHLTENQLLAKAREFYAAPPAPAAAH
jgi:hypothetical protein